MNPPHSRHESLLGGTMLALGFAAASAFLISATVRLRYPYELEWLESETLQHVARVLQGQPLFAPPSSEFAPTIYPPLYAWVSALAARVVGLSFLAPRLVSVVAMLGSAWLAARAAFGLSGSRRGGLVAALLLLAAYVPCGTAFDLARLDALWLFSLLVATSATAGARSSTARAGLAGVAFALATATKQPAVLLAGGLAAWVWRGSRKNGMLLLVTWLLGSTLYYGSLHLATAGWSTFYLAKVPLLVAHEGSNFLHLVRDDLLGWFAPALALIAVALLAGPRPDMDSPWPLATLLALAMTASMRTLQGGWLNGLLPAVGFGAVLAGGMAGRALQSPDTTTRVGALALMTVQFARLLHSPLSLVPAAADRAAAAAFVARVEQLPGEVWIPSHNSYAFLAGKPFLVHRDPLLDLYYAKVKVFPDDLPSKLGIGRFGAVLLDGPFAETRLQEALDHGYTLAQRIEDAPQPLVGYRTRPTSLYLPKSVTASPAAPASP